MILPMSSDEQDTINAGQIAALASPASADFAQEADSQSAGANKPVAKRAAPKKPRKGMKHTHETALDMFKQLGVKRNLRDLSEMTGVSLIRLRKWQSKYQWIAAARDYDAVQIAAVEKEIMAATVGKAQEWVKRDSEIRGRLYSTAERLIDKANKMLEFPLEKIEYETDMEGRKIAVHVYPAKWTFGTASKLLDTASSVQRKAVEVDTLNRAIMRDESAAGNLAPEDAGNRSRDAVSKLVVVDSMIDRIRAVLDSSSTKQAVIDGEIYESEPDDDTENDSDQD